MLHDGSTTVTGTFSSKPYGALADDFRAALAWLEGLGVSYERTRVGEYERAIQVLLAAFKAPDFDAMRKELLRIVTALFEIHDLIDIHRSLGGRSDGEFKRQVQTLATGPANYTDEDSATSSNAPRNIAFEFVIMAKLVNAGIPLKLP